MKSRAKAPILFLLGLAMGGGFYFYQMILSDKTALESFRIAFPEVPVATIAVFLLTLIAKDKIKKLVVEKTIRSSIESDLMDYLASGGREGRGAVEFYIFSYRATAFMAGLFNSVVGSFFFLGR